MLTIRGAKQRFCYGISRRRFFKIRGFALNGGEGLTLVDVLRAEDATGQRSPHKAVNSYEQGPGMGNLTLNGVSLERLQNRKQLLRSIDSLRREVDADGTISELV